MALTDKLSAIGNAIREKGNTTELLTLDEMPEAIAAIESGGGGNTQIKEMVEGTLTEFYDNEATVITTNSVVRGFTYDKVTLAAVELVDTEALTSAQFTELCLPKAKKLYYRCFYNAKTKYYYLPEVEATANTCFYMSRVEVLELPKIITAMNSLCYSASYLTTVSFPLVTTIQSDCFYNCSKLTEVNIPETTNIWEAAFKNCYALESIGNNPLKLTYLHSYGSQFYGCRLLKYLDCSVNNIPKQTFYNCYSLKAVFLRNTDAIATLTNTNAFTNCYHFHGTVNDTYNPNGDKDGYIYVPSALIEEYKVATNWVTLGEDRFRALEDYTVDGTTTGAIDWSKIDGGIVE